jgi:uncharacterized protein YdaU (DUF1376 family)
MKKRNGRADHHVPAFQFYPADFLADSAVVMMSMEERGVYITLLCHQWIERGIPDDLDRLSRICHMPREDFERIWRIVGEKFRATDTPGQLANQRLERERQYMTERSAERAEILAAARAKKQQEKEKEHPASGQNPPKQDSPKGSIDSSMIDLSQAYDRSIIDPETLYHRPIIGHTTTTTTDHKPQPQATLGEESTPLPPRGGTRKRKPATGPHAEVIDGWCKLWLEIRGTPYQIEPKDGAAVSTILGFPGNTPALTLDRARRLLLSRDTFLQQNASLPFLRSRWNQLAPMPATSQIANEPKGFAGIREYYGTYTQEDLDRFAAEEAIATKSKENTDQ